MTLPPGTADPLFMHELALELGMTVKDLGQRADVHELTVSWPLFFAYRRREAKREEQRARSRRG
jgi:hypothetical protein